MSLHITAIRVRICMGVMGSSLRVLWLYLERYSLWVPLNLLYLGVVVAELGGRDLLVSSASGYWSASISLTGGAGPAGGSAPL
jgi:hypothetical protein